MIDKQVFIIKKVSEGDAFVESQDLFWQAVDGCPVGGADGGVVMAGSSLAGAGRYGIG